MTPSTELRNAMEKMPADSGPCLMGVSKTCQVFPASGEWKTRAALPPVANQILKSSCEEPAVLDSARDFEAASFHQSFGRIAMQVFEAANAPSPSRAGGSCADETGRQVCPSSVSMSSNFSLPESSGIGSPSTTPCFGSQNAIESKNPLGLVLVNCSCQCCPASAV